MFSYTVILEHISRLILQVVSKGNEAEVTLKHKYVSFEYKLEAPNKSR